MLSVFENRMIRREFELTTKEVTGVWRKSHGDELHDSYSSANVVRIFMSRRMRWAGRMGEMKN
jgi:hypothetical protein